MLKLRVTAVALISSLVLLGCDASPDSPADPQDAPSLEGRWDVTVQGQGGPYPSWFELSQGGEGWSGQFVGRVGSARPIEQIEVDGDQIHFQLPVQYESHDRDMEFTGHLENGRLVGTTNAPDGSELRWTAERAPALERSGEVEWQEPIELIGDDLEGWEPRSPDLPNNWTVEEGVLKNTAQGTDLMTQAEFEDFRLQTDFRYPEASNSGIYLRGRYEVQIQDDFGKEPDSLYIGGVYGFLDPTENAALKAGEWQTYDITLIGRRVTIVLNGKTIIDNQEIPGPTGGALDSQEAQSGPLLLQGDHGPVSFRNMVLTPAAMASEAGEEG